MDYPEHWAHFYGAPLDGASLIGFEPLIKQKKKELRADDAGLDRAGSSSGAEPTASSATVQRITKGMLAGLSPPPATVYLSPRRHGRAPGSDSSGSDGWDPKPDKRLIGRKR